MRLDPFEPIPSSLPGAVWLEIIRRPTSTAFAAAFAPDVVLEGGVLLQPVVGPTEVRRVFEATKSLYDAIGFTLEETVAARTYLHWEGRFEGRPVSGLTVLTRTATGLIGSIALYHRPLAQVVGFASELSRRLRTT
ncbi:hypothetical protein [Phenylobacterium sp.]|jgi:hypothetical protein|uniref:hypothetical protein n=1 Tax=Phenylobacterium sp. TaxID=1871053 RepID=UPI00120B0C93|nr:hypothetical protein [Phenylobacterium sp.]THD50535.1 MAG: hypothetical protein E8A12_22380 [Phenylobacterium sp.]